MSRYYFDIADGQEATEDPEGLALDGVAAARDRAVQILNHVASPLLRGIDERTVVIRVSHADGTPVLAVGLMATVRYGDPARPPGDDGPPAARGEDPALHG